MARRRADERSESRRFVYPSEDALCCSGLIRNAAYLKNPTNPDSNAESSAASSVGAAHTSSSTPGIGGDPSLAPAPILPQATLGVQSGSSVPGLPSGLMEPNYEVFDPLNWLLDGLVDLPYSYSTMSGMEAQGIA